MALLPLGEGWDGASMLAAESPSPVSLFVETGEGLVAALSPWGELERGFGVLSPVPLHKARGLPPLSSYLVWTAGDGPSVFIVLDYGHPV